MAKYKVGRLTDEEKRIIEQQVTYATYTEIAKELNRSVSTVRKYCARNKITTDAASIKSYVANKLDNSPHFRSLRKQLTTEEIELVNNIYNNMMRQFGSDILYSEEMQIIDCAVINCLLDRALYREKVLTEKMKELQGEIDSLKKKYKKSDIGVDDKDDYYDRIDDLNIKIGEMALEMKEVKKNQLDFIGKKEQSLKSLYGSRDQRAKDLVNITAKFSDLVMFSRKNPAWRRTVGGELARFRLATKEEYIRLGDIHKFADGELDLCVLNSDTILRVDKENLYEKYINNGDNGADGGDNGPEMAVEHEDTWDGTKDV